MIDDWAQRPGWILALTTVISTGAFMPLIILVFPINLNFEFYTRRSTMADLYCGVYCWSRGSPLKGVWEGGGGVKIHLKKEKHACDPSTTSINLLYSSRISSTGEVVSRISY